MHEDSIEAGKFILNEKMISQNVLLATASLLYMFQVAWRKILQNASTA